MCDNKQKLDKKNRKMPKRIQWAIAEHVEGFSKPIFVETDWEAVQRRRKQLSMMMCGSLSNKW